MITRSDYLSRSGQPGAHDAYYDDVIDACGGPKAFARAVPVSLDRVCEALAAGDLHLNTIPLAAWNTHRLENRPALVEAFRARGDFPSHAGAVCALKRAAVRLATIQQETTNHV